MSTQTLPESLKKEKEKEKKVDRDLYYHPGKLQTDDYDCPDMCRGCTCCMGKYSCCGQLYNVKGCQLKSNNSNVEEGPA